MFLALNDIPWSEALSNTAIGIGTVFIMLIFISLIISCFGIFPKLEKSMAAKKTAGLEDKAAPLSAKAPAGIIWWFVPLDAQGDDTNITVKKYIKL